MRVISCRRFRLNVEERQCLARNWTFAILHCNSNSTRFSRQYLSTNFIVRSPGRTRLVIGRGPSYDHLRYDHLHYDHFRCEKESAVEINRDLQEVIVALTSSATATSNPVPMYWSSIQGTFS